MTAHLHELVTHLQTLQAAFIEISNEPNSGRFRTLASIAARAIDSIGEDRSNVAFSVDAILRELPSDHFPRAWHVLDGQLLFPVAWEAPTYVNWETRCTREILTKLRMGFVCLSRVDLSHRDIVHFASELEYVLGALCTPNRVPEAEVLEALGALIDRAERGMPPFYRLE